MKTQIKNKIVALFSVLIIAGSMTSCDKIEFVESPFIEITSPAEGSTYKINDEVEIEANIDAGSSTILTYDLKMQYKKGKELFSSSWSADADQAKVDLTGFHKLTEKENRKVIIEVCANLSDNTTTCENMEIKFEK